MLKVSLSTLRDSRRVFLTGLKDDIVEKIISFFTKNKILVVVKKVIIVIGVISINDHNFYKLFLKRGLNDDMVSCWTSSELSWDNK